MRQLAILLCACLLVGSSANAGAWLRETGQGFTSVVGTLRYFGDTTPLGSETSAYLEWGFRPKLTLGVDTTFQTDVDAHALVFARFPLGSVAKRTKVAAEIGVGAHEADGAWDPLYKIGLSVGRGFDRPGGGWAALDTSVERREGQSGDALKVDATIGIPYGRLTPLLQVETLTTRAQSTAWSATLSVLIADNRKRRWQIGVERKSAGTDTLGLTLGVWRDF